MIYDYKSDETVQDVILECYCPLVEDVTDEFSTLRRYNELSIYAPSYVAREILSRMLDEIDEVWVHADSHNELLYKDDNEVLITIGYDGMIFVEEARIDGVLIGNEDCSLTYIYDGFSKKDIDELSKSGESILVFGFEEEEIEETDVACKEESKPTTSANKESYTINGKPVSKDEFLKVEEEFNKEFRERLLSWCEVMDSMNEMRKMFRW